MEVRQGKKGNMCQGITVQVFLDKQKLPPIISHGNSV